MSNLAPLLEIQAFDRAIDAARARSAELPERERQPVLAARISQAEVAVEAARQERAALETREHALEEAVTRIAREIEAAELARYSGKRKDRDEAAAHDASQQDLRDRQAALEEEEMTLLESIERVESQIAETAAALARDRAEIEKVDGTIREVESAVTAEIDGLVAQRAALVPALPGEIVTAYERVRAQPRNHGRGATTLVDKRCGACRIELPSLERRRMLEQPPDALIQCPQCRRVLVREE